MADNVRRSGRLCGFVGVVLICAAGMLLAAGSAMGAQATNQLLTLKMEEGAASPTVLIQTAESVGYRYTVYDSFDPVRVVVDFPGMSAGVLPETVQVGPAPLKELKVAKFDLSSGSLTRVEIILAANAEYQVALDGKNFRVVFPGVATAAGVQEQARPVAAAPAEPAAVTSPPEPSPVVSQEATIIKEVTVAPGRVLLATNGNVGRFEHFTLGNPPRLVVDLYGLRPVFKQRVFDASAGMKQVRVGAYGDKVRFVFDADGRSLPEHMVEKQDGGLAVTWGEGVQATAPAVMTGTTAVEPVAAATVEEPVKPVKKAIPSGRQVTVDGLDFVNRDGRSYVVVTLSAPANITQPVQEGNQIHFEVENAAISRSLRRSIDASSFPSAVSMVTPYIVTEKGISAVRIAVELKGTVPFTLVDEGEVVKLVIDDGVYAEVAPKDSQILITLDSNKSITEETSPIQQQEVTSAEVYENSLCGVGPDFKSKCPRITLTLSDTDIRDVLALIQDAADLNIIATEKVKGKVTLFLKDVPWDVALKLAMEIADLEMSKEGNVIRVLTKSEYLERQKQSFSVKKEEVDEGVLESRYFSISYSKVEDAKKTLATLSSKRGTIFPDARNKQLIVTDVSSVLDKMAEMIKMIDRPERQVMIEARIVEANTNFSRQLGVKWNFDSNPKMENEDFYNGSAGLGGSFLIPVTNPAAAGGAASLAFGALEGNINVDLRLSALESSGEGKIISTPRITTLNGQKALISQGTKIPYSTTSDAGTSISFESAELKLDVTPEINPDGTVILDIKASNSAVGTIYQTANGETPAIEEKKAETKVLVRDGQTTVIGGIFVENESDSATGVPLLMDIPYLGHLFKSTSKSRTRRELLIFITPRILES